MKLAFTGVHGTGKTTLINELLKLDQFKNYYVSQNLTRKLAEQGYPINEQGTVETQKAIMDIHANNVKQPTLLSDRSAIDCFCYTKYLFDNKKLDCKTDFLVNLSIEMLEICQKYDKIFYLKPEFAVVDDGVRSVDNHFHTEVFKIFETVTDIVNEMYPEKVVELSGTVQERVFQIWESIHD